MNDTPDYDTPAYDYDAAIIGGGPGGAATAIALRRAGRSVLLLEAEQFPRFHIGESLLPMSNFVFEDLGVLPAVVEAGFQEKNGATFIDAAGECVISFDFNEWTDLAPRPTFEALRSELDELLLNQAREAGADVQQARATDFECDTTGARLDFSANGGEPRSVRVGAIVDASGRAGFVARRVGVREQDAALQKAALYGHFTGVPRLSGRREGDIRIVSVRELGWIWLIPLADGSMSVGMVLDLDEYKRLPDGTPEEMFLRYLDTVPAVRQLLADAELVSPVRVESSFSYSARRYAADRWFLVGDSGSFLDPVFSSGVLLALLGAADAARAIDSGLSGTTLDPSAMARFDRRVRRRYKFLRRFILGFYRPGMRDLFFAPKPVFGVVRAIVTMLAGGWDPGFVERRRIDLFYMLARLQQYLPLAPRRHAKRETS